MLNLCRNRYQLLKERKNLGSFSNTVLLLALSHQDRESVAAERDGLKALAEELGRELHQSKAQLGEQKTAVDYLSTQLEVRRQTQYYIFQ